MFNKELKRRVEDLEKALKPSPIPPGMYLFDYGIFKRETFADRLDSLEKNYYNTAKMVSMLLQHFNLEYVKLTEENGSTKVKEKLRTKKVKKAKLFKRKDLEDEE